MKAFHDLTELPTPSLILDRSRLLHNVARMQARAQALKVQLRPHLKTAKSARVAELAHNGAKGPITVSTLAEAAYFARHGFRDITYAVPIGPQKLDQVAALMRAGGDPASVDLKIITDHPAVAQAIADKGRDGFYTGWVAEDIVKYLNGLGATHSLEDFATQEAFWVDPIATRYKDVEILEIPPNGVGIITLLMLNILSGFDLGKYDPVGVERFHIEAEATRLAFQARDLYVADPAFADVPLEKLLSPGFADELRGRIDLKKAMPAPGPVGGQAYRDTVYISVVDAEGNACSFINSLFWPYGSALCSPKTGVLLQNRGCGFKVQPGHLNCVEPWKRPLHTIIPAMALKDGQPWLSFGVMGGGFQPVGQSHVLTNMVDFGMNVQEAIDCARGFHVAGKFEAERGIREDVLQGLANLGHEIKRAEMPHGGGQAILIDRVNGLLQAGSDPRKDGCALAY